MLVISLAQIEDASAVLALQKLAYQSEAQRDNDWSLPPLVQSVDMLRQEFVDTTILKATVDQCLVGSVRAKVVAGTCAIGRLMVDPRWQGQGIGSRLLREIEERFQGVEKFELFTGSKSEANIRLYQRHGYVISRTQALSTTVFMTYLEKSVARRLDSIS